MRSARTALLATAGPERLVPPENDAVVEIVAGLDPTLPAEVVRASVRCTVAAPTVDLLAGVSGLTKPVVGIEYTVRWQAAYAAPTLRAHASKLFRPRPSGPALVLLLFRPRNAHGEAWGRRELRIL